MAAGDAKPLAKGAATCRFGYYPNMLGLETVIAEKSVATRALTMNLATPLKMFHSRLTACGIRALLHDRRKLRNRLAGA